MKPFFFFINRFVISFVLEWFLNFPASDLENKIYATRDPNSSWSFHGIIFAESVKKCYSSNTINTNRLNVDEYM